MWAEPGVSPLAALANAPSLDTVLCRQSQASICSQFALFGGCCYELVWFMFYYRSCKSWHHCMEHIYNERYSCGFTEVVVDSIPHVTIFIRWSGVSFCLYRYDEMMYFNAVNIMILKFLSASSAWKRKRRPTLPKEIFPVCKSTHFQANLFSQDSINEWVLFSPMLTAVWWLWCLHWMLEAGRGGISSCWNPYHAVLWGELAGRISLQSPSIILICSSCAHLHTAD